MTATGFDGSTAARTSISEPLRANHGNSNYTAPGDADTARISGVILWYSRFGVPLWRRAIALRLMEITALYRAHGLGLSSPG